MQRKILLTLLGACSLGISQAQNTTAFAITAAEKGRSEWKEVRLVDFSSGNEIKPVYKSLEDIKIFNARSGKEIQIPESGSRSIARAMKPFATNSAACAYDKKHERLYYTPMGIAQLRYIDLKGKAPRVFYFEDEVFGALTSPGDVARQITRMAIASDGNGYALSNDAEHLIRFTTGRRPEISDLGPLTDDPANIASVHDRGLYGGDMIADSDKNLYLITANRAVFQVNIESRIATYKGQIKGLPRGYSTNGAVVAEGTKVIVSSSNSTQGYYQFDIRDLQATVTGGTSVYNASDLANGNLLSVKKKKKERKIIETPVEENSTKETETVSKPAVANEASVERNGISVFPNPVTTGLVKVSFGNQPAGRYQVTILDIGGRVLRTQEVTVNGRRQLNEVRLPEGLARGSYLVRVAGNGKAQVTQVLVQ